MHESCPTVLIRRLSAAGGDAGDLRIEGTALISVPSHVAAVEFRAERFVGPQTQKLEDCALTLEEFTAGSGAFHVSMSDHGPRDWKPPEDKPFRSSLWVFVADDGGRVLAHSYTGSYGGQGSSGISGGLRGTGAVATRLVVVRPLEVEQFRVPIVIEGIRPVKKPR
jgi:hypothetical protein